MDTTTTMFKYKGAIKSNCEYVSAVFLADTGAGKSFISSKFVSDNTLVIHRPKYPVKATLPNG